MVLVSFCATGMLEDCFSSLVGCWDSRPPQVPEMNLSSPSGQRPSLEPFKAVAPFSSSWALKAFQSWSSEYLRIRCLPLALGGPTCLHSPLTTCTGKDRKVGCDHTSGTSLGGKRTGPMHLKLCIQYRSCKRNHAARVGPNSPREKGRSTESNSVLLGAWPYLSTPLETEPLCITPAPDGA